MKEDFQDTGLNNIIKNNQYNRHIKSTKMPAFQVDIIIYSSLKNRSHAL